MKTPGAVIDQEFRRADSLRVASVMPANCTSTLGLTALPRKCRHGIGMIDSETVCLVACTSRKGIYPTTAQFLYQSPLFWGAKNYAETRCDSWFILSAKYGLVAPTQILEPYDESLYEMTELEFEKWAARVYKSLCAHISPNAKIVFLAGAKYRSILETYAAADHHRTIAPLSALGIGRQVAWLQKVSKEQSRLGDIDRLYSLLDRIEAANGAGFPALSELDSRLVRPSRGLYFFFEHNEFRMTAPFHPRVVRVGTHAVSAGSKATLWNRLRTHRGGLNGAGNHRGSIFRLHVGESLIRKAGLEAAFPTWGVGQSASEITRVSEQEVELEVSETIGGMRVLWLEVPDSASPDSDRSYLERNVIALLSGQSGPLDLQRPEWLGHWSSRDAIRFAGLWNVNHVYESYERAALDVMEKYVELAEGKGFRSHHSLAPTGWRARVNQSRRNEQLELI